MSYICRKIVFNSYFMDFIGYDLQICLYVGLRAEQFETKAAEIEGNLLSQCRYCQNSSSTL